ncbi:AEC family transporter [Alteromonas sp. RKMC-009]|uniref:AEC family transporter n=1 Tax=Alteromonas sp. RKMC-009 TaxID=2267264 RepID=UPI000C69462A|nr:AEC family transporter [Alteromonas sp. RKMC-009]AYA63169.1 AEC family transporter [Alteromonas sp. RKMC-009]MBT81346.1 transporter [Alteromonadaceae bacterium]MBT82698.1 transporter [Alteromonadaceae bacterium]
MFSFITETLLPVLILLLMGWLFFRIKWLNESFVEAGSKLVFNVTLPALLFLSISQADFAHAANFPLIGVGIAGTLIMCALLVLTARMTVTPYQARGVVVQGGFRANMGIIGLAYCANTYGPEGLAAASVYLGCITILFNILSVIVLNFYQTGHRSVSKQIKGITKNPLIISIVVALPFSYYSWTLPDAILKTGEYVSQLTLPLALICTGASLQFRSFSADWFNITLSTVSKCILYPALMVGLAYLAGFTGMSLGIVLLLSIAPTAAASYVMVRNMGGDHRLAASIIAVSTLVSLPVTALAFGTLTALNLV